VAQSEEAIIAEGVQIVWVLEKDSSNQPGTAFTCKQFVESEGSDKGLCVGDGETQPTAGTFDQSPFAVGRGFDMLVRRSNMEIVFASSHGSPGGNDNLTGAELLSVIQQQKVDDGL
tara:strand:+ start:210 stop:557 length:348 start_codon:yes stop_codon:yes gene_type:complete